MLRNYVKMIKNLGKVMSKNKTFINNCQNSTNPKKRPLMIFKKKKKNT